MNCVGQLNVHYFYKFLTSVCLSLVVCVIVLTFSFVDDRPKIHGLEWVADKTVFGVTIGLIGVSFVFSFAVLVNQSAMIFRNQTQVERALGIHAYDKGWRGNVVCLLGLRWGLFLVVFGLDKTEKKGLLDGV